MEKNSFIHDLSRGYRKKANLKLSIRWLQADLLYKIRTQAYLNSSQQLELQNLLSQLCQYYKQLIPPCDLKPPGILPLSLEDIFNAIQSKLHTHPTLPGTKNSYHHICLYFLYEKVLAFLKEQENQSLEKPLQSNNIMSENQLQCLVLDGFIKKLQTLLIVECPSSPCKDKLNDLFRQLESH